MKSSLHLGWSAPSLWRSSRLFKRGLLCLAVVFALGLWSFPAASAPTKICGYYDAVVKALKDGWKETRKEVGLNYRGSLTQLFTSPGCETWSIVVTRPNKWSCVVDAGENWTGSDCSITQELGS